MISILWKYWYIVSFNSSFKRTKKKYKKTWWSWFSILIPKKSLTITMMRWLSEALHQKIDSFLYLNEKKVGKPVICYTASKLNFYQEQVKNLQFRVDILKQKGNRRRPRKRRTWKCRNLKATRDIWMTILWSLCKI